MTSFSNHPPHSGQPPTSAALLAWATAPLANLPGPAERIVFALAMASEISGAHTRTSRTPRHHHNQRRNILLRRALADFWHHTADIERLRIMADARGETSDLFKALAHHRRKAFSALTAVPGLTLDMLYPAAVAPPTTGHAGTHPPPLRIFSIKSQEAVLAVGGHSFDARQPSQEYRTKGTKRDTPSTSQRTSLAPSRGRALSEKSVRRRTCIRDTAPRVPGHEGA